MQRRPITLLVDYLFQVKYWRIIDGLSSLRPAPRFVSLVLLCVWRNGVAVSHLAQQGTGCVAIHGPCHRAGISLGEGGVPWTGMK